jgi:hypothetical protein
VELQFDVSEENKKEQNIPSAPLEPNIEIRTMKSDIQALKESGGSLTNVSGESAPTAAPRPAVSEQPIFSGNSAGGSDSSPFVKTAIIIIIVIVLAVIAGFASYYVSSQFFK